MHASLRAACAIPFLFVTFSSSFAGLADDSASLEEVVVTADLRDRELRDLPASATVLDAHTLEIAGVQHFQDVLGLVPNLNWSAGTSRPRFFQLRGIGELEQWQGAPNPSVGFLIDGIDFSGIGMPATLADVERIEVLRGPQGTAYGANALAGLIAVNTRAPRREPELDAKLTFGDYGTRGVERRRQAARSATVRPRGGSSPATIAATASAATRFLRRDDTNGYDESNARSIERAALRTPARRRHGDVGRSRQRLRRVLDRQFAHDAVRQARAGHADLACARRAPRLRRRGSFRCRQPQRVRNDRAASIRSTATGVTTQLGRELALRLFPAFRPRAQTLSQICASCRASRWTAAPTFAWLAGAYALRTDEDVGSTMSSVTCVYAWRATLASDYRATNLAVYGELEWRLAPRRCSRWVRAASTAAPTTRIPTARLSRPTRRCSADR